MRWVRGQCDRFGWNFRENGCKVDFATLRLIFIEVDRFRIKQSRPRLRKPVSLLLLPKFLKTSTKSLGIAGMCSKTAVAPLDRIKILLQAHQSHYKHLGVFSGLLNIVKKESFLALYKGNGAQMVRIFPYAATQFTAFEIYKRVSHCYTCHRIRPPKASN